jgi:hypothetical protein
VVFTFEERVFDMVIEGLLTLYYLVVCLFAWFQQVNPLQFTIVVGFNIKY